MFTKFISIFLLWLLSASVTLAQVQQSEWTPWEQDSTCLVSETHFTTPDARSPRPSAPGMILQWYVWGNNFITNVNAYNVYGFGDCFSSAQGAPDCGLPKNSAVANYMYAKSNTGSSITPKLTDEVIAYFSKPPPAEAIKYAAKAVGRCFGKDSAGFTLEDLELVRVDTPAAACQSVAAKIESPWSNTPPYSIKKDLARIPVVKAWGNTANNIIGWNAVPPSKPIESCSVAPAILAPILAEVAQGQMTAAQRAKAKSDAERVRLVNRTDEERFMGLNGCQIAYSLVFQGINSQDRIVGFITDDAIDWALKYEKANLRGLACPPMPISLSDWVQKQPMATFQAEPDPYTEFRSRKGPGFDKTYEDWLAFAEIWMSRYDTQKVHFGGAGSTCDAVLYYARSDRFRPTNEDNGPSAFVTLARLGYSQDAALAMCAHVPVSIITPALDYYVAEEQRKRQEREAEMKRRQPITPVRLPKQNYLWKNSSTTTRCYWAGDTASGQKNVCFTN